MILFLVPKLFRRGTEVKERCTHLPLFGIQLQQLFRLFFIPNAEIVLAIQSASVQIRQSLALFFRMFIVFFKGELVNCTFDVGEIGRSSGE